MMICFYVLYHIPISEHLPNHRPILTIMCTYSVLEFWTLWTVSMPPPQQPSSSPSTLTRCQCSNVSETWEAIRNNRIFRSLSQTTCEKNARSLVWWSYIIHWIICISTQQYSLLCWRHSCIVAVRTLTQLSLCQMFCSMPMHTLHVWQGPFLIQENFRLKKNCVTVKFSSFAFVAAVAHMTYYM